MPKTSLWPVLSKLGREIETPKGIFYWSSRAKAEAEIDATIGIAQDDDGTVSHLKIAEEWAGGDIMKRVPKAKVFGYAPIEGVPALRKKWLSRILAAAAGPAPEPVLAPYATVPVVTNGITHSLAIVSRMMLEPGQEIITADKSWENYEHIFTDVQGIKIRTFNLFSAQGELDLDSLAAACEKSAKLQGKVILLLNFPHNQTGFMPTHDQAMQIAARIHRISAQMPQTPLAVLLDDAYEGYVYDKNGLKGSLLKYIFKPVKNLSVVKLDGISKVMLAYGYRVGFITFFLSLLDGGEPTAEFNAAISAEAGTKIGGFVRGEISQVNHHGQILADALMDNMERVERERAIVISMLAMRWQALMRGLEEGFKKYGKERMHADPCNAGFFCYINLALSIDPKNITERLLKERRVGVVPGAHGLRVAFAGVQEAKISEMVKAVFEVVNS